MKRLCLLLALFAIMPFAGSARAADDAVALLGNWTGSYVCAQGETGVTLSLDAATGLSFNGSFSFFALPQNPGVPSGSFAIAGTFDPQSRRIAIEAVRWIEQPPGYIMVGMTGTVSADLTSIVGNLTHPSCAGLSVSRKGKEPVSKDKPHKSQP